VHRAAGDTPLVIPEESGGGGRIAGHQVGPGKIWGISLYTPVIVKISRRWHGNEDPAEDLLR